MVTFAAILTMVQVTIPFCDVEMFQCLSAAFNAFEALDVLKRVFFFRSRSEGHLCRSESHCTIFGTISI